MRETALVRLEIRYDWRLMVTDSMTELVNDEAVTGDAYASKKLCVK